MSCKYCQPEERIKLGDVVRLKSGGPKMTVVHIAEDEVAVAYSVYSTTEIVTRTVVRTALTKVRDKVLPNPSRMGYYDDIPF